MVINIAFQKKKRIKFISQQIYTFTSYQCVITDIVFFFNDKYGN